jgi:hypothetical protein
MSEISNTKRLWVVNRHSTFLILAQGPTGTPEPVEPAPILYTCVYVPPAEGTGDIGRHRVSLEGFGVALMARFPNPDGPPAQTAIVFPYFADETVSYVSKGRSFQQKPARAYVAAGPHEGGYGWISDIAYGRLGYFLVGDAKLTNLWRTTRVEVDYAQRYNFTLTPTVLAHGLPSPDFSRINDGTIRQEIQQHWSELENALVHYRSYAVVTSAKNVAESLLYYFLLSGSHILPGNRDLASMLKKLNSLMEDPKCKATVPFDSLAYHLIQKMRILHGKTHIGRVISDGRSITPECALTVASDLVEVLKCAGLIAA